MNFATTLFENTKGNPNVVISGTSLAAKKSAKWIVMPNPALPGVGSTGDRAWTKNPRT
jgi:hypothetical protein